MQNLESFFDHKFNAVTLQSPLFNSWDIAIRFDILNPLLTNKDSNDLEDAFQRSTTLYDEIFRDEDELLVIADVRTTEDHLFLEEPLKVYRSYIKQQDVLDKLRHELIPDVCNEEGEQLVVHRFTLGCKKKDIRYEIILREICYKDFGEVMIQLEQKPQSSIEFYFINLTRGIIYHLYDGPGCDILALKKEEIQFLYESYNDWISEEERNQIDSVFANSESIRLK